MTQFNPEFISALAHGDQEAYEKLKEVSLNEKMSIGAAVEEMRRTQNIVPVNSGMTIYERQKSKYVDDDAIREAMKNRMEMEKAERERQLQLREEYIREQTKAAIERSRSGLPMNGKF